MVHIKFFFTWLGMESVFENNEFYWALYKQFKKEMSRHLKLGQVLKKAISSNKVYIANLYSLCSSVDHKTGS